MARRVGIDKQQVLATAAELADKSAPNPLSLQLLAAELGVRVPSLYNYVDGLPGLEDELAVYGARLLTRELGVAAVGKSRDEAVLALAYAFRAFILEHPGLYALSLRASRNRQPAPAALTQTEAEAIEIIGAVIGSYGLAGNDLLHAIRGLRSFVHGFATLQVAGGFGLPLDLDTSFDRLVRVFIRGLSAPKRAPRRGKRGRTDKKNAIA